MQPLPLPESCPLVHEAEVAIAAARAACPAVLKYYRNNSQVEFKNGLEPVTQADRECQEIVIKALQRAFPKDSYLSEEAIDDSQRLGQHRVWIVDPVDGTGEFIKGILEFVIMIGLSIDGVPKLGVLLQPGSGRLFVGLPGYGSYLIAHGQTRELKVSARDQIQDMPVVLTRSHLTPFMEEIVESIGFTRLVRMGSAGLKAALVAEQGADCYLFASLGMKEWDMCAPAAVLFGAGAKLTDCWGEPLKFNQTDVRLIRGFVASNGPQHETIVAVVRAHCHALGLRQTDGFLAQRS